MKIRKTLSFMMQHPIAFIIQLIGWFLYAAYHVVTDDAFNNSPGVVWLAKTAFSNLPGSLENFAIIISTFFDEVVKEAIKYEGWFFICLPAFIIGYREAHGNLKGVATKRKLWMQWYDRQQETITNPQTLQAPPSTSEDKQANSYFRIAQRTVLLMVRNPKHFILHFACWFSPFVLLFVVDWAVTPEIVHNFVETFTPIVIFFAILAFISCYQETRGTVKGVAKEGEVWTKWYQRQINAIKQGYPLAAPPPSLDIF